MTRRPPRSRRRSSGRITPASGSSGLARAWSRASCGSSSFHKPLSRSVRSRRRWPRSGLPSGNRPSSPDLAAESTFDVLHLRIELARGALAVVDFHNRGDALAVLGDRLVASSDELEDVVELALDDGPHGIQPVGTPLRSTMSKQRAT